MLKRLYIRNIAIIEKTEIEFAPGLCVLSGETGAGKSIIIDSINAVTGSRTSRDLIRTEENSAVVSALFEDIPKEAAEKAAQMGIDITDKTLLLRREIFVSGHNSCHINGQPATIPMLRELGSCLISIHGQHDGLHLLDENLHIDYLDGYAQTDGLLSEYLAEYDKLLAQNRKIKALSLSEQEKEKRLQVIESYLSELSSAGIAENEWEELKKRKAKLDSEEKLVESLTGALKNLDGDEDTAGACAEISAAAKLLSSSKIASCEKLAEKASEIFGMACELSASIASAVSETEYSPELAAQTDERIDLFLRLSGKCRCRPEELFDLEKSLTEERDTLLRVDENIDGLREQYAFQRSVVTGLAGKLHEKRTKAAEQLGKQMENTLAFLDMPNARFFVDVSPMASRFTKKGTDTVQFLLSANTGEELKPLVKVASGGELSRIMLSFQSVLSESDHGVSAVFDEVDAGVSGKAASRVARMLKKISQNRQVLCVTHLPQIACAADEQYRISKRTENGRTYSSIEHLSDKGRIEDICRLIGGENITEAARKSAEQMLFDAKKMQN